MIHINLWFLWYLKLTLSYSKSLNFESLWPKTGQNQAQNWTMNPGLIFKNQIKLSKNPKQIPDPTQDLVWCEKFIVYFFLQQTLIDKYWTKKYLFLSYNSWKAIDIFPVTNWDYWIVLAPILKPDFCGGTQKIFQMKMNDESPTNYTAL